MLDESPGKKNRKESEVPDVYSEISLADVGYNFVPRYNGLFDPFGNSKLTEALLASVAARVEKPIIPTPQARISEDSTDTSSPNRKSRYERLFDTPEVAQVSLRI